MGATHRYAFPYPPTHPPSLSYTCLPQSIQNFVMLLPFHSPKPYPPQKTQKKTQRAAELFQEMKDRKITVDHVTYGSLIHAFAKGGQWEAALSYLEEMRSPSSGVKPNNFVYCSAMSACNRG